MKNDPPESFNSCTVGVLIRLEDPRKLDPQPIKISLRCFYRVVIHRKQVLYDLCSS